MDLETKSEEPAVGHSSVPLWIKIMWIIGVAWIIGYIVLGLKSNPTNW